MSSDEECGGCQTPGGRLAVAERYLPAAPGFSAPRSQFDCDAKRLQPPRKVQEMLLRQNFRRGHKGDIVIVLQGHQRGTGSYDRLAGTYIALEQPPHRVR